MQRHVKKKAKETILGLAVKFLFTNGLNIFILIDVTCPRNDPENGNWRINHNINRAIIGVYCSRERSILNREKKSKA
jgi:hypothetical protein